MKLTIMQEGQKILSAADMNKKWDTLFWLMVKSGSALLLKQLNWWRTV